MAAKKNRKKTSPRAVKAAPVSRKRRVGRPAKAGDPVQALREARERLETLFEEARKVQEATLQGVRRLVETTTAEARSISEQLAAEVEKLDAHARTLQEKQHKADSLREEDDR